MATRALAIGAAAFMLLLPFPDLAAAQDILEVDGLDRDTELLDVLTRGPLHEAFAETYAVDPVPGLIAPQAPPEPIREIPPELRPEEADAVWIPGYYAWDGEREDFIWVSGVWRVPPPGYRWAPGYWRPLDDPPEAHQWVSGFWVEADREELLYAPEPPASLETGPTYEAPGEDYFWNPGVWQYASESFDWRPGYWAPIHENWVWTPDCWNWTPRGYVYTAGRWDYRLPYRGVAFAPVHFHRAWYARPAVYVPRAALRASLLALHLFVRPGHRHYYFGSYYGVGGYRPWHTLAGGRGYDPLLRYYQWHFARQGVDYRQRLAGWHTYFQNHRDARLPLTYANLRRAVDRGLPPQSRLVQPLSDLAGANEGFRLRSASVDRVQFVTNGRIAVDRIRDSRRNFERVAAELRGQGSDERRNLAPRGTLRLERPAVGSSPSRLPTAFGPRLDGRAPGDVLRDGRPGGERPWNLGPSRERNFSELRDRIAPGPTGSSPTPTNALRREALERLRKRSRPGSPVVGAPREQPTFRGNVPGDRSPAGSLRTLRPTLPDRGSNASSLERLRRESLERLQRGGSSAIPRPADSSPRTPRPGLGDGIRRLTPGQEPTRTPSRVIPNPSPRSPTLRSPRPTPSPAVPSTRGARPQLPSRSGPPVRTPNLRTPPLRTPSVRAPGLRTPSPGIRALPSPSRPRSIRPSAPSRGSLNRGASSRPSIGAGSIGRSIRGSIGGGSPGRSLGGGRIGRGRR